MGKHGVEIMMQYSLRPCQLGKQLGNSNQNWKTNESTISRVLPNLLSEGNIFSQT